MVLKTVRIFFYVFVGVISMEVTALADVSLDFYQYFDSQGVKIAYRTIGSGSALVLINGGPGRASDTFTDLARDLSQITHRQVILFDQRGTGRSVVSPLDETTISLDLMVNDLEALRVHLNLGKMDIIGHSFGGMYAMAYAAKFPKNVQSLILSCSGGLDLSWMDYGQHNILARLSSKQVKQYKYWNSPEQVDADPVRASLEALRVIVPAYVYRKKFVPQLEHDLVNLKYFNPSTNGLVWKSMKNLDLKVPLSAFGAPTLIIDGRQDLMGEAVPIAIHNVIKSSILVFLDECVHYPWLDSPRRYFREIKTFLN